MKRCFVIVSIVMLSILCLDRAEAQALRPVTDKGKMVPEAPRKPIAWYSHSEKGWNSILSFKLTQDFEGATFPPTGWTLEYSGTQYWSRSTASGYLVGAGSAKFDFWDASTGTTQSLVTPDFPPTVAGDSLQFDYADAFYNAGSIDSLIIETSTDGGTTYTSLVRLYSSPTPYLSLSTVSSTSLFTPTLLSDWGTKQYEVPVGTNKVRFMAISGFGNNLYIDNIFVGVPAADDIAAQEFVNPPSGGTVLPSTPFTPTASFKNVGTALQSNVSVRYEIRNSVPSVVYTSSKVVSSIAPGAIDTMTFDPVSGGLTTGSYTLRIIVVTPDENTANDTLNGTLGVLRTDDIAATMFVNPTSGSSILPDVAFTPTGSFQNVGVSAQINKSVMYKILNSTPSVVYTSTKIIPSIAAGAIDTVTFDLVTGGLTPGTYTLNLIVATPDQNTANDTLVGNLTVFPVGTYLSEGFTGTTFPPSGWSVTSTSVTLGWSRLAAIQSDGTSGFAAKENFYSQLNNVQDSLKTSVIDLSALAPLTLAKGLSYDYAYAPYSSPSPDSVKILVSSDGGATWPSLIYNDGAPHMGTVPPQSASFTPSSASQWRHMLFRIPDSLLTTNCRILFLAKSGFGNNYWLDNVKVSVIPDTDYALLSVTQVHGIPSPFNPILLQTPSDKKMAMQTFVPNGRAVPASNVNNSFMLDQPGAGFDQSVRAYLKGSIFTPDESSFSINAQKPDTLTGVVQNIGLTSPAYSFVWTFDGVGQPPSARPGLPFLGYDTVALNIAPTRRGTLTATGFADLVNDHDPSNNSITIYRVLSYPDTPVVRIRYDNGANIPSTFIGYNGGAPTTAGVRFRATANMRLANIDAYYRNESAPDSIVLQIWAAGVDTTAPGILLYTQKYGGVNYIAAGGDYFTLPLPANAPAFAAGSDYWISLRFVQPILFPMGSQSSGITLGHSYVSGDSGRTWSPLIISSTQYAWLLRTVGIPATPTGPVISQIVRSTRVPTAGDTLVVTATLVDSLGVTGASLLYSMDGVAQTPLPFIRTGGTPQNGSYRGVIPGSANTNGARIEYRIQGTSASGLTTTTAVAGANSYFAGISPLSTGGVRSIDSLFAIRYRGYYARLTGTINGPNFQASNLAQYFQDGVGGMEIFLSGGLGGVRNLGDSIMIVGRLDQFRGVIEVIPDSLGNIQTLATGRPVPIIDLTVSQYNANPEVYESRLLRFSGISRKYPGVPPWPPAATQATIVMYQTGPNDTVNMFINAGTNIPGSPEPSYPVNLISIGTQFTSTGGGTQGGYEVLPRYITDFTSLGLSGTYTVGAGGNFPTLDSAFSVLRTGGVTGPVTFSLTDSVYAPILGGRNGNVAFRAASPTVELDPLDPLAASPGKPRISPVNRNDNGDLVGISLTGPIPGASATNRVTIRPATGVRARITGTGAATFNFLNVSYVTFDGIATTGATQLDIENTATNGIAIALLGHSDNNIVQNLTLRAPYASGIAVYMDTASLAAPDSNQVLSNLIRSAYFGLYVRGGNYVIHGTRIMNNAIGSATDSIGAVGIYNQQVAGNIIAGNYVQNVKDASATGGNIAGMWIATKQMNMRVYNNVINGVRNRPGASAAVFAAGVYHFGTAGDTTRSKFYNNMVYGVDNPSTSATATLRGMYLSTAIQDTAAFNSVYVTGTDGAGIVSGALYASSNSLGLTLKDNIGINARTTTGTGRAMALYITAAPTGLTSNYNDLYVPNQVGSNVAAVGTTNYQTLAAWQATGRDSQSVNVTANFVVPDLHIDSTISTPINGGGTPVPGITTDIDGQTRNATTPDIGADEFNAPPPPTPGWTAQTSGITNQFYSVKAVSQSVAWAAAIGGRVLRTVNGGNAWTSVGGGHIGAADIYNIEAVSGSTAFVTTTPGATYIFRTTNGGTSWDTVYTLGGTGAFIDAIKMTDANNGIALGDPVGGKWTIVRTSNGGASWVRDTVHAPLQVSSETSNQNDLCVVGGSNIWYGSTANGRVYRSTDGGNTWLSSTLPGAVLATNVIAVWFNGPQYGIASAVNGSTYTAYRSTDGGASWSTITVGTGGYNIAVAGSGTDDFWMAGGTNMYRSTNRGATWAQSYTGTGTFYDVDFYTSGSSTYGWGVKDNGNIVMGYFTITGVDEEPLEVPQSFAMMQNYPNPFNPTTTIRYALPKEAQISLIIYNILGQQVATLRDQVENVGFHDVVWNGRSDFGTPIASGVYFYRIEARPLDGSAPFSSIKKMLMLK